MSFGPRHHLTLGPSLTPMVKYLIIGCAAASLLQMGSGSDMIYIFGLTPSRVLGKLYLWQLVTYLFIHDGLLHIFFNMFALWMFGCQLERYWGGKEFLRFYFITGVGAGVLSVIFEPFSQIPTVGASGSIYGILMAYGMMFPERVVLIFPFFFPVKVKYMVGFLGAMAFISALGSSGSGIAHIAHLGGMVFAFLYLKGWLSISGIRQAYYRWRLKRMRERFRVYDSEERKREDDFWIN